eukprot:gene13110-3649_t
MQRNPGMDPDNIRYWVCVFAVSQHWQGCFADSPDSRFEDVIAASDSVLLMLHPWKAAAALGRVWCLYEVLCCMSQAALLESIDVAQAEATIPQDKALIFQKVSDSIGFEECNRQMGSPVKAALKLQTELTLQVSAIKLDQGELAKAMIDRHLMQQQQHHHHPLQQQQQQHQQVTIFPPEMQAAFIFACEKGFLAMVKLLLAKGMDPDPPAGVGTTYNLVTTTALGGSLYLQGDDDCTGISVYAVKLGNLEIVRLLLSAGADPNQVRCASEGMETALGAAVLNGHLEVVRLLLNNEEEEEEEDGEIAEREKADRQVWRDIVKLLVSYGHRLNGGHLGRAREAGCHPELQDLLHEL